MSATRDPEELADALRSAMEGRLARRDPGSPATVLGAGRDDLDAGRRFLHLLADGGWATPTWPVEHGGLGLDARGAQTVREALADFEAPDLYPFMVGIDLIGPTILAHGTPAQQDRWLDGIRTGREVWCQLFSEPDAGSDLANLSSRAVPHDDRWVVTGSKVWSSRAHYSQWGLLLARSDPSVPKHRGITAFALDMAAPGVTVRPLVQMNGDAHFNEVFLDEVEVPDADRIGAPGEGWRVAMTCLGLERGALAGGLGVSADRLRALAATPGLADPVRRDRLVRQLSALEVLGWSDRRAAEAAQPGVAGSLAKLGTNAMVKAVASLAVEACGPAALVADDEGTEEWRSMLLVSPSLSIRGGTDEINRNIVGERGLGLPAEPRVDKDRPFAGP